jgi:hypothetical protein
MFTVTVSVQSILNKLLKIPSEPETLTLCLIAFLLDGSGSSKETTGTPLRELVLEMEDAIFNESGEHTVFTKDGLNKVRS